MLRLAHSRRVACWPWGLRHLTDGEAIPGYCRDCEREVAVPRSESADEPVCLYCGLASGLLAEEEAPIGEPWAYTDGRAPVMPRKRTKRA